MIELAYWAFEFAALGIALRSRRWALMAMAFSLPFVRRMPALPIPFVNFENLLFLAVVASFAFHPPPKDAPKAHLRLWLPLSILALFTTASFLNTFLAFRPTTFLKMWDPYRNVIAFKAAMMCLGIFVLASVGVRTLEDMKAVLQAAVAGMAAEGLYTATEYVLLTPGRATGHMTEPNSLGAFLSGSINLMLALGLLLPRGHRFKWPLVGAAFCAIVGLLGTLSRGSYMAAGAGFAVITGLVNRKILAAGLVALALNSLWLPDKVRHRLDETFQAEEEMSWRYRDKRGEESSSIIAAINERLEGEAATDGESADTRLDPSLQARIIVWTVAVQMMADYPFGVGFGVFPWYVQYYSDVLRFKATHNIYLKVGCESGVVALALFLLMLAAFLREGWRLSRETGDPEIRAFGYGMIGYVTALSVNALTVDVFFQTDVNGQFWLLSGLLMRAAPLLAALPRAVEGPPPGAGEPVPATRPLYELVR